MTGACSREQHSKSKCQSFANVFSRSWKKKVELTLALSNNVRIFFVRHKECLSKFVMGEI